MKRKKNTNSRVQNGRMILVIIGVVTLVDMILKAFSVKLTFPCKLDFPLWLVSKGGEGVLPLWTGYVSCVLLACVYLAFFFLTMNRTSAGRIAVSRQVWFRIGWVLYLADTLFYSIRSASEVSASGFSITHIIEILFHIICTVLLFLADRASSGPDDEEEENVPSEKAENKNPPGSDPEDDEGIQW